SRASTSRTWRRSRSAISFPSSRPPDVLGPTVSGEDGGFERGLRPRNPVLGGGIGRGAKPPSEVRAWHRVWPSHLPHTLDYPREPAWRLLERNLPRFADRVALRELDHQTLAEGRVLTFEALWRAARATATGLRTHGVVRGTRVGYCLPNSAALVIGYYATW